MSVGNTSDGGAHGKMFCGTGDNDLLLTGWVRDRAALSIEEGVHILTSKIADFFGLDDRGRQGCRPSGVRSWQDRASRRREDLGCVGWVGGRTYRYTRAPAPMRLTLVNGVPTFDNGAFTGRFPGAFIGPERRHALEIAAK